MADAPPKKHKVTLVVAHRQDHHGIWAAHKHWPEGANDAELTEEELADVFPRPQIVVMQRGKQVTDPAKLIKDEDLLAVASETLTQRDLSKPGAVLNPPADTGARVPPGQENPPVATEETTQEQLDDIAKQEKESFSAYKKKK